MNLYGSAIEWLVRGARPPTAARGGGGWPRFAPVRRVEFLQDVRYVDARGLDADDEFGGDLAVGVAAGRG